MTLYEIKSLYKDIFELIVKDIISDDFDLNKKLREYKADEILFKDELTFESFLGLLITMCILEIHGLDELSKKTPDEMYNLINDFYTRHLKKITKTFTSKYGVSMNEEELNVLAKVIKL